MTKVRVSHILVSNEEKALDILTQIENGESFEKLAREHSTCPSRKNGGDLGWFGHGVMVRPFEKKAFELKKGEVGLTHTQFGWHVIKVTDRKG